MQVVDRIAEFQDGGETEVTNDSYIRDRTKDEGYGKTWSSGGLSYPEGTKIGEGPGSPYLPIIEGSGQYNFLDADYSDSDSCIPGLNGQCMFTNSRRWAATFYKDAGYSTPESALQLFTSSSSGFGAWNFPDLFKKRFEDKGLGQTIWDNSKSEDISKIYDKLHGGEFITFESDNYPNYKNQTDPSFNKNDKVTHIGMIVGKTPDGIPIVEHSYETSAGKKVSLRQPINAVSTLQGDTVYTPSGIFQVKGVGLGKDIEVPDPLANTNFSERFNQTVQELEQAKKLTGVPSSDNTETDQSYTFKAPARFANLQDLDLYLNNMSKDLKSRLKGMGTYKYNSDINIFTVPKGYEDQLIAEDFYVWSEKNQKRIDRIDRKENRKKQKQETKLNTVPRKREGGLIYKR